MTTRAVGPIPLHRALIGAERLRGRPTIRGFPMRTSRLGGPTARPVVRFLRFLRFLRDWHFFVVIPS